MKLVHNFFAFILVLRTVASMPITSTKNIKCGFVGCGTIAAAIATGLASSSDEEVRRV